MNTQRQFFPKVENRQKLFDRIRKSFERLSNELGLFVKEGQNRPIYVYRHSFISGRRKRGVDANVVALNSNTGVPMINQHYQDMSDDHLLEIHNKLFPERTKNSNYKVITKKRQINYVPYYVPFQKPIFSDINSFGSDNRTPLF